MHIKINNLTQTFYYLLQLFLKVKNLKKKYYA